MCIGHSSKMGLVGVWPKDTASTNRQLPRQPCRRRKRRCFGGKSQSSVRFNKWFCYSDVSGRLTRHLGVLSIFQNDHAEEEEEEDEESSENETRTTRSTTLARPTLPSATHKSSKINMPGGFENSSMKSSFSLSSLQPSSLTLESPEHAALKDRPYSSLRKKPRRDPELDFWRRSWGSKEENKDDFWGVIKNDYQSLISDSNLIDSCQEARKDLQYGSSPTHEWTLEQFTTQFVEMDEWLERIQEAVYNKSETVIDRKLRLSHMEKMQRKTYKRKLFNNQGGRLVARDPKLKDEVAWRVVYLNCKWERLEAAVSLRKRVSAESAELMCPDVEHEFRVLRKWFKETEKRLKQLELGHNKQWTIKELEEKAREQEIVCREVWSHGRIVRSVRRLCEQLNWPEGSDTCEGNNNGNGGGGSNSGTWLLRGRRVEAAEAVKFAQSLERRWEFLYLDCLEQQCFIEQKAATLKQGSPLSATPVDSDEEPVTKHPRLARTLYSSSDLDINLQDDDECLMDAEETGANLKKELEEVMEVEFNEDPFRSCEGEEQHGPEELVEEECDERRTTATEAAIVDEKHQVTRAGPRVADVTIIADSDTEMTTCRPPQSLNLFDHSKKLPDFKSSDCNGRIATLYFAHKDTDNEAEKASEESSEEEWTFQQNPENENKMSEKLIVSDISPERPKKEEIERLVNKVQEMVVFQTPERRRGHNKFPKVVEWLDKNGDNKETVGDSCDASGEYTTEDDENEARLCDVTESTITDLDVTVIQQECCTVESFSPTPELPKVTLRAKKRDGRGQRPWSVSEATGVVTAALLRSSMAHSISESALHQLSTAPSVKMDSSMHATSTLSSSTVEDTAQTQEGSGGGYSSSSLRRRKLKMRKRTAGGGRRSDTTGSADGLLAQLDASPIPGSPIKLPNIMKATFRRLSADKVDSPYRRYVPAVESPSSTSSTPSDSESDVSVKLRKKSLPRPSFLLGPAHTVSSYASERKPVLVPVSNESSYSEQAWDNYQEKYMSEPYSEEPPDAETARRLLEFGDDYRNYLDSQSDCASSSLGRHTFQRRPRKIQHHPEADKPDSGLDYIWNFINQSNDKFLFSEQVFNTQLSRASPQLVLASDFAELVTTCKDNVKCLKVLLENLEEDTSLLTEQECKEIRGLIERWENLEKKSEDLQRVRSLTREMSGLKEQLLEIGDRVARLGVQVEDRDQLEDRIQEVQREVGRLSAIKPQLLQVNVAVHRFLTDSGLQESSSLKDEVAELYRTFDDICGRVFSEEASLKEVTKAWQQFETHLATLQGALRNDSETLRLLDQALQQEEEEGGGGGRVSTHLASSVRDLAKLLSEKEQVTSLNDSQQTTVYDMTTSGGSYSDSGISDSGSEVDLSEREKKLAALRKLVRSLEAVLAPGSIAIGNMAKRIEQTERELRGLQMTCRDLMVRTAVCAEAKSNQTNGSVNGLHRIDDKEEREIGGKKGSGRWWLWRAIRAGLPFQLAIMAILCIACLLEPQCCDSMNSLSLTLAPHLRYVKGPPPV